MISPVDDRRPPITPQLALRVAVLGGLALVLFGIVFFRLWYLQVLSGDQYVQQANANRVRHVATPAPRGDIVDRNGQIVVTSRAATAVQIVPDQLPADTAARQLLYARLGRVLQMSPGAIEATVAKKVKQLRYANVTIKLDAGRAVLDYIAERGDQFGAAVVTPQVYLRQYPNRQLAAQLLGTVGEIDPAELKLARYRSVRQGTVIGKGGIEWSYDRYLRGRDGDKREQVNANGLPARNIARLAPVAPKPGHQLKLSLDIGLQKEGQSALGQAIGLAQGNGHPAQAGAFVALDPSNGQVLAMGSYPSFDPTVFAKPISRAKYRALSSQSNGAPLYDRAIAGQYPTGSTFKPITALASLQTGLITPETPIASPGCITIGSAGQQFCSAGKADFGTISLRDALRVSSDVYFYRLGEQANGQSGEVIQSWARRLGLGHPTGIDLPGEYGGLIPDRAWRARVGLKEARCRARRHVASCGISDERPWTVGDNVNFAVGQGDLQATPLQMAVAYSTIVNGGRVVRPHLGLEVEDHLGRLVQRITPGATRHVAFSSSNRQAILDGLRAAASQPGGTSADVFNGFPRVVYGKTGTAQRQGQDDQSWYVCYAPDARRPVVVAVTVEKGGFGAEAAAPAARLILSQWFGVSKQLVAGHSRTR
ncbi:MAG TPA: penicillin-binding protein 2 [Solirubrobacteraceae bacterium]|nr:penicillin-binding protein 2 [Solirubrobacteraceae bacterium]